MIPGKCPICAKNMYKRSANGVTSPDFTKLRTVNIWFGVNENDDGSAEFTPNAEAAVAIPICYMCATKTKVSDIIDKALTDENISNWVKKYPRRNYLRTDLLRVINKRVICQEISLPPEQ